ncbi:MAG: hypothetical protein KFF77_06370 [Bacteroidetes bacterium]|nr:hypothetical protein [Bacteroidota bacterium]
MKTIRPFFLLVAVLFVSLPADTQAQDILVDHTSVALFEFIPPQYAEAAARLRLLFMDRSVGGNIDQALGCLASLHADAPNFCRRWQHRDSAYAVDPREVYWEGRWDRSRWRYEFWPSGCSEDADCFISFIEPRIDSFDVVGFQHSYLAVTPGSGINDAVNGYFGSRGDRGAASYAAFAARHPEKTVLWWTSSLARGIGSPESEAFNDAMRAFAAAHDLVLFDVADILSHDPQGNPCFDNRDGVTYLDENHPDDGRDIPAICPQYTTETEGGHLGSISAGGIRVAKAFWVLMARIAGWDGLAASATEPAAVASGLSLSFYPNPAREAVTVRFTLPEAAQVRLSLHDLLGRDVAMLHEGEWPAGSHVLRLAVPAGLPAGRLLLLRLTDGRRSTATTLLLR